MRQEGKRGTPKALTYRGVYYPTCTAFARAYGLDPRQVYTRVHRQLKIEVAEEYWAKRNLRAHQPIAKDAPRSPMYVETWFGVWKV